MRLGIKKITFKIAAKFVGAGLKPAPTTCYHLNFAIISLTIFVMSLITSRSFADRVEVWVNNLNHTNEIIRKNAAMYLGQIGDKTAIEHLVNALGIEESSKVKVEIIESLGRLGDEKILTFLRANYLREKTPILIRAYVKIIGLLEKKIENEIKKQQKKE